MDAEEARHVDATLRRLGIPGIVAPENPDDTAGAWRVYDSLDPTVRKDTTPDVLAAVVAQFGEADPKPPRRADGGPTRGFIIPPDVN
ncbi:MULTISPECIES: hypothetical protein [Streptomyces]|uniref:Uncharacterized protein n=2 Tax=Streptomyces rimosus subsp. rimosus TaxID=132474 RepID=L8EJZ8_STRR1|nr:MULTISPECIES: hypothetical protein [Streptomyces]KOG68060.1 hypothetical protein ADK78_38410 [Kitasatospora aureofaciens]MYT45091.1 hypothetical protein [Streptomyces sp. SID5471]KEF06534.1 hypothetical protein DF17_14545 [Streptomyces rimosus]KEF21576.1 hypothetical protein DF18_05340 [Streptomyces rimosus]KOT34680.1 hypothetical protein ADK84_23035 [Streptomyces sp. NRRL WC-3701]